MQPLKGLGLATAIFLGLSGVMALFGVYLNVVTLRYLRARETGQIEDFGRYYELSQSGVFQFVYSALGPLFVITALVFLVWFYRSYTNIESAGGPKPQFAPIWTVFGFLVPVMNLFRPYQIMKDVVNGSFLISGEPQTLSPHLITIWWVTFVLWLGVRVLVLPFLNGAQMVSLSLGIFSGLMSLASASCAVMLVRGITTIQSRAPAAQAQKPRGWLRTLGLVALVIGSLFVLLVLWAVFTPGRGQ
jgi:hypothetical protein